MKCPRCDDERISRIQHMECDACGHWWCDGDIEQALAASRRALTMAAQWVEADAENRMFTSSCTAEQAVAAIKAARTSMNRVDGKKEKADGAK